MWLQIGETMDRRGSKAFSERKAQGFGRDPLFPRRGNLTRDNETI